MDEDCLIIVYALNCPRYRRALTKTVSNILGYEMVWPRRLRSTLHSAQQKLVWHRLALGERVPDPKYDLSIRPAGP